MDQEPIEELEQQLASARSAGVPAELRRVVLRDIHRELRAARWDRRLGRAAFALLVIGVGMNGSLVLFDSPTDEWRGGQVADERPRESLVETAIVVAEATDTETGRQFARQIAAMSGRELTDQEREAIELATDDGKG